MIDDKKIAQVISKVGLISSEVLEEAEKAAGQKQQRLGDILIEKNLIKPEELGQLVANLYKVKFADLNKENIPDEVLRLLPEIVAAKQQAIVFRRDQEGIKVAMADPGNLTMLKLLEKKTGERAIPYYSPELMISQALSNYRKSLRQQFEEIIKINVLRAEKAKPEDISIVKIVDNLVAYAFHNKSSDIHIEPHKDEVTVRFRIDGILHDVLTLPKNIHDLVVTRVKILSKLRTDEHRSAQDGKMFMSIEKNDVDIRVSILPTTQGEKVVMRLLASGSRTLTLEELGFNDHDLAVMRQAITRPHGMLLSTGPTGSGKTTTLYSLMLIINSRDINISTIEDPVEYYIDGVNQIQVNPKTNLTFAAGLRSLLRQDPDVIMVGEIRDQETASIAINSAMTGHLVLSTLHTNDAATSLPRLYDMKIEPFLIASTVNIIIAQRLVRRICMKCIVSYTLPADELKVLASDVDLDRYVVDNELRAYKGKGCDNCQQTGYRGRVGIFEVLEMKDNIRQLVMDKANADQIRSAARSNGMMTMIEDGFEKVMAGKTTMEEILRAIKS